MNYDVTKIYGYDDLPKAEKNAVVNEYNVIVKLSDDDLIGLARDIHSYYVNNYNPGQLYFTVYFTMLEEEFIRRGHQLPNFDD